MNTAEFWGAAIGSLVTLSLGVGVFSWQKGLGFNYGFWYSFFLSPLIGAIIVAGTNNPTAAQLDSDLLASGQGRQCPFCAEVIKSEAIKCKHCGEEIPSQSNVGLVGSERKLPQFRVSGTRRDGKEVEKLINAVNEDAARCIALASGIRIASVVNTSIADGTSRRVVRYRIVGIRGNGTEVTKVLAAEDEATASQIALNAGIYVTEITREQDEI